VVNTCFGHAIVVAGATVMTRETLQIRYGVQELAPRLLLGFLAANFATQLCRQIITLADTLTRALTGDDLRGQAAFTQMRTHITGAMTTRGRRHRSRRLGGDAGRHHDRQPRAAHRRRAERADRRLRPLAERPYRPGAGRGVGAARRPDRARPAPRRGRPGHHRPGPGRRRAGPRRVPSRRGRAAGPLWRTITIACAAAGEHAAAAEARRRAEHTAAALSRIYAKLGISSRLELARVLDGQGAIGSVRL
jgi:hypothetical protein